MEIFRALPAACGLSKPESQEGSYLIELPEVHAAALDIPGSVCCTVVGHPPMIKWPGGNTDRTVYSGSRSEIGAGDRKPEALRAVRLPPSVRLRHDSETLRIFMDAGGSSRSLNVDGSPTLLE